MVMGNLGKFSRILGKKSFKNIWSVLKSVVILHRFSPQMRRESGSKKSSLTCLQQIDVVQENRE